MKTTSIDPKKKIIMCTMSILRLGGGKKQLFAKKNHIFSNT
jgi:hypothetical protein